MLGREEGYDIRNNEFDYLADFNYACFTLKFFRQHLIIVIELYYTHIYP